jgi:glycosyltransferase involved in cell wall biosynthesis
MLFSGAMDWLPNVDAVKFFVKEVLPLIRTRVPETQLWVVGRNPSGSLVQQLTQEGIRFTGTVDDIRPYLSRARLVVVPLRIGGGTRLKILEAWAMGKPVLSTSIGAEGLPAVDGANIAIADAPEAMAERAIALLHDAASMKQLGASGRRTVTERFAWKHVAEALLQAYEQTLSDAGQQGRRTQFRPPAMPPLFAGSSHVRSKGQKDV